MVFRKDYNTEMDSEAARIAAAVLIQRLWRGRKNKAKDEHMTSEARWEDAANSARLEKPIIAPSSYLSAEQRLNYLVKVNVEGKLYWAKNNQLVDTTAGDWKDAGAGHGIVPESLPTWRRPFHAAAQPGCSDADAGDQVKDATHYVGSPKGKYTWSRYLRERFIRHGMMQRLLRKMVKRNTWIYVSHFHKFIDVLTDYGVDMHKVRISEAEAALWGVEHMKKFKAAKKHAASAGKAKMKESSRDAKGAAPTLN
ncbi:hypothetical protein HYPSUDRAFT_199284 [Hypholoma sublateritium FD-334 SS-4]|uniref:Uncharacterized protein n=1 Tax=Hypholoma sublateritium (strain FD-334 SS-4) TaxID=945553 RepID=A0A0D2MQ07_HYPSF|nr:hypothetical protein HYPSUDRAFT_199284 [Hypholoma sublateritium FD-334 SS-4]